MSDASSEAAARAQINLATAALVIALVALFTTLAQVTMQFFATADGYRRCQSEVIGPWAKYTRLRWRWRQFRFETIFITPDLLFSCGPEPASAFLFLPEGGAGDEDGEADSDDNTMESFVDASPEAVTWLPFLGLLQNNSMDIMRAVASDRDQENFSGMLRTMRFAERPRSWLKWPISTSGGRTATSLVEKRRKRKPMGNNIVSRSEGSFVSLSETRPDGTRVPSLAAPTLLLRERSWDFVPPEVIRPYAMTNVRDIAILARRVGMRWKTFRPEDGVMQAQGSGHLFSSIEVRSLGIMLQYRHMGRLSMSSLVEDDRLLDRLCERSDYEERYIPDLDADRMGFGLLSGDYDLKIPGFNIGDEEQVVETMLGLDCSSVAIETLRATSRAQQGWMPGFADIISMASPMMRLRNSSLIMIPAPMKYVSGLTVEREGFKIFHHRLEQFVQGREGKVTSWMQWVLEQYEGLRCKFPEWEDDRVANRRINTRSLEFLEAVHDTFDATQRYFVALVADETFQYLDLLACHIEHAVHWFPNSNRPEEVEKKRETFNLNRTRAVGMHLYFDDLPKMKEYMRGRGVENGDQVVEAWFVLMLRAFCWQRTHFMVKGPTVPPENYTNLLPVAIG